MKKKIQGDREFMINRYRRVAGLLLTVGMLLLALPLQAQKQPKEFTKWPTGSSP
jgi:hypothetical protein